MIRLVSVHRRAVASMNVSLQPFVFANHLAPSRDTTSVTCNNTHTLANSKSNNRLYCTSPVTCKPKKWKQPPGSEEIPRPTDKSYIFIKGAECDIEPTHEEIEDIIEREFQNLIKEEDEELRIKRLWKPGMRKKPLEVAYDLQTLQDYYGDEPRWTRWDRRCGALGIKLGMMPIYDKWGERIPCTVLFLDENVVMEVKSEQKHGYDAIVVGAGERKKKNVTKPLLGHYNLLGIKKPPYVTREFRINRLELTVPTPGTRIHARHFVPGQNVDISGITKGKGFQGAMKKWGFKGMPASHGVSLSHRALGSTGSCQDPGKVFKGKKMAGRMGGNRQTIQNLRVVKIDRGNNLIYIKGQVPGNKGQFVEIRDSKKKPLFRTDKVENGVEFPPLPTFEGEKDIDGSGNGGFESMMPLSELDPLDPLATQAVA